MVFDIFRHGRKLILAIQPFQMLNRITQLPFRSLKNNPILDNFHAELFVSANLLVYGVQTLCVRTTGGKGIIDIPGDAKAVHELQDVFNRLFK